MAISLYTATVPSFLQYLAALSGLLDKAEAHCSKQGIAPEALTQARLAQDMLPFGYQVKSTVVHSLRAIEAVRRGLFVPDQEPVTAGLPVLRQMVRDAHTALKALDPQEINSFEGRDVRFQLGDFRMDFTAEDFLFSLSQPNFYFHVTTAYDILRSMGVQIGKADYVGALRIKK